MESDSNPMVSQPAGPENGDLE